MLFTTINPTDDSFLREKEKEKKREKRERERIIVFNDTDSSRLIETGY